MRRIVKYNVIRDVNEYLKKQIYDLKQEQSNLLLDIEKIKECYQGRDADIIISRYTYNVKNLSIYIKNVSNYISYFNWLVDNYSDSYKKVKNNLNNNLLDYKNIDMDMTLTIDNLNVNDEGEKNG